MVIIKTRIIERYIAKKKSPEFFAQIHNVTVHVARYLYNEILSGQLSSTKTQFVYCH